MSVAGHNNFTQFDLATEDASLNQYWYSARTIETLVNEIELHATRVAFLSTPSLYFSLRNRKVRNAAVLFEYDPLFADIIANRAVKDAVDAGELLSSALARAGAGEGEDPPEVAAVKEKAIRDHFVLYDFNKPDAIPIQYMNHFDYIVIDPPFITEEVWGKYAKSIAFLLSDGNGAKGKVLLTSVLENHPMLEALLGQALFIAPFMPAIPHLIYQYFIFTNYLPCSGFLSQRNVAEVPFGVVQGGDEADSAKEREQRVLKAIQMANDIRESEICFIAQWEKRDRAGEVPLPAQTHRRKYVSSDGAAEGEGLVEVDYDVKGQGDADNPLIDRPINEMRWNYVPEGLTEYAPGGDAPAAAAGGPVEEDYGPAWRAAKQERALLEEAKRIVDNCQRVLDVLVKAHARRDRIERRAPPAEVAKGVAVKFEVPAADTAALAEVAKHISEQEAARTELVTRLSAIAAELEDTSLNTAPDDAAIVRVIRDCAEAYTTIAIDKAKIQELAADATRKYKSPLFNKQKALLQHMKELKAIYFEEKQKSSEGNKAGRA